jgi:hypothetical protein
MIGRKFFGQLFFAGLIATIFAGGFAADSLAAETKDTNPDGSCAHAIEEPQTSVVDMPDYAADVDENPAQDADAEAAEALWHAYQASIFDKLSASSDPHDWALATLVHVDFAREVDFTGSYAEGRAALMKRAVSALPDDAMIQWIALEQGQGKNAKMMADAALQKLQSLEPDNAAVWNEVLVRATISKDIAGQDAALARMAMSSRFDVHFADSMKRLTDAYRRNPVPDEYIRLASKSDSGIADQDMAAIAAAMTAYAMTLPAFQHVVNACRLNPTTGEHAARAGYCATIGRTMAFHADTLIANRIGFAVLRVSRTFTPDDVQNARPDDWVYRQYTSIVSSAQDSAEQRKAFQKDWYETGSEMEAMRRMVANADKPLTPPDDWLDDNSLFSNERLRSDEDYFKKPAPVN